MFAAIEESYFDAKVDPNGLGGDQKSRFFRVSAGARCQIRVRTPQKHHTLDAETATLRKKGTNARGAAENSREAVIITDRRFQDNITALMGAAASCCKHPKLAAALEKSLMSMMLAADASDSKSQTSRGKQKPEPCGCFHTHKFRSVYDKLLLILTVRPAKTSAFLPIGWSGRGHAPRGSNKLPERAFDLRSLVGGETRQMFGRCLEEELENKGELSPSPLSSSFRLQRSHFQPFPSVSLPRGWVSGSLSVSSSLHPSLQPGKIKVASHERPAALIGG